VELSLERIQLRTQGCWPVATLLRSEMCHLRILDLSNNEISPTGAICLAKSLTLNASLLILSLRSNMVDSVAAVALGQALESNKVLRLLDLENNDIEEKGMQGFVASLSKNSTLVAVSLIMNEFESREGEKCFSRLCAEGHTMHAQMVFRSSQRMLLHHHIDGIVANLQE